MDGPAVTHRVQKGYQAMHPSLVEKPVLSVADLHLIAKVMNEAYGVSLSVVENNRLEDLFSDFGEFLDSVVGEGWPDQEALVS